MEHLNQDLLWQRMTRGIVTGPAEQEKEPMKRCNGVMENGRRCSVVPLPGHEYCRACEVKEARGEMPPLAVAKMPVEPVKRGRPAKIIISDNAEPFHAPKETPLLRAHDLPAAKSKASGGIGYDNNSEKAALAGGPVFEEVHGNMSSDHVEVVLGMVEAEIPPVAVTPPQEQVAPFSTPSSGLARLLLPVPPPKQPDGLVIPFAHEEVIALIESNISAQDIRELVLLLLDGKLLRLPDAA